MHQRRKVVEDATDGGGIGDSDAQIAWTMESMTGRGSAASPMRVPVRRINEPRAEEHVDDARSLTRLAYRTSVEEADGLALTRPASGPCHGSS